MAVTWDPAFKDANVTLSAGNLTAAIANTGVTQLVRATQGVASGKWYWEVHCDSISDGTVVGVIDSTEATGNAPGFDTKGDGWVRLLSGAIINNTNSLATIGNFVNGDVIGIAIDRGANSIKWYKNNVLLATTTGAGNVPAGGTWYPSVGSTGNAGANTTTARFAAAAFTYAPPAGYLPYDTPPPLIDFIGSVGIQFGAAATLFPTGAFIGSAGIQYGVAAAIQWHMLLLINFVGSAGISFGGEAGLEITHPTIFDLTDDLQPRGGMQMGGSAAVQEIIPVRPTGGMKMGGAAAVQDIIPFRPSGGLMMGGTAQPSIEFTHVPSGGFKIGGTAPVTVVYTEHPAGGMKIGGAVSEIFYQALYVPSGGMRMGGSAAVIILLAGDVETPENPLNEDFLGWAVNLENNAPSVYERLPANSFTQFQGKTYAANAAGIYELGANDDAGQPIRATVMVPTSEYGTANDKRMSAATVSAKIATRLRLAVRTNNGTYYYYSINKTDGLAANRVKLGQGLKGRYWDWRIENEEDGGDFDFEALGFTPIELSRHGRAR